MRRAIFWLVAINVVFMLLCYYIWIVKIVDNSARRIDVQNERTLDPFIETHTKIMSGQLPFKVSLNS